MNGAIFIDRFILINDEKIFRDRGSGFVIMKVFISVLILMFSLQSWTKADDIRDFEMEGISIGDSLLDYLTKEEINNLHYRWYPKKKYKYGYCSFTL